MVSTSEHPALAGEPEHQHKAEAAGLGPDPSALGRAECGGRRPEGSPAGLWLNLSRANRQVSARESSSSADRRDRRCGAAVAWPSRGGASLCVLWWSSSEEVSVQQARIVRRTEG